MVFTNQDPNIRIPRKKLVYTKNKDKNPKLPLRTPLLIVNTNETDRNVQILR